MHILYLSSTLPKRSETFVYREVFALRAQGVNVSVASLHRPEVDLGDPALDALGVEAVPVYARGLRPLFADAARFFRRNPGRSFAVLALALRDALTASDVAFRERPKVFAQGLAGLALAERVSARGITHIHVHFAHAPATVGMYAARSLGLTFSLTGHAVDLFRDRCLLIAKLRRAAFVACISHWHREWYRTLVPRSDADYPVIRCGVDPCPPVAEVEEGRFRIFALGRLVPKKGFDVLLRAVARLRDQGLAFHCTLGGDGPERDRLQEIIREESLEACVTLPGSIANRDLPRWLGGADVLVLPCRIDADGDRDGIPVVLMEAMSAGICVVSGDLPAIRELVEEGVTGRLIAPGDVGALVTVLESLAADPDQRRELGARGRKRVEEEFSTGVNIDRLLLSFRRFA